MSYTCYQIHFIIILILIISHTSFQTADIQSEICSESFEQKLKSLDIGPFAPNTNFTNLFDESVYLDVIPKNPDIMNRWNHMLYKLFSGKADEMNFVFLGGSMVLGGHCFVKQFYRQSCAYPTRVGRILDYLFVDSSIDPYNILKEYQPTLTSSNLAVGGYNTKAIVPTIPIMMQGLDQPPSAVFIDFSVNDPFDSQGTLEATEALVRWLLETYPSTAIFFVEAFCLPKGKMTFGMHRRVAMRYDIPLFSYRSSVEKHCLHPDLWGEDTIIHPAWHIHKNIAHTIVKALFTQRNCDENGKSPNYFPAILSNHSLPPPISKDLQAFKVCTPISFYSASECIKKKNKCRGQQNIVHAGGWDLVEERNGKPGWISDTQKSFMEFKVQFGKEDPRLIVGYLRSYEKLGNASIAFPREKTTMNFVLNGFLNSHASQTLPNVIRNRDIGSKTNLSGLKTVVRITNQNDMKFKIIYVLTC